MRLLLRADAYLAESEDGAYMLTHQGPVSFTGPSVHRMIETIAPYLDGRHTLAELTADMSTERADVVRRLVGMLLDRGVVREAGSAEHLAESRPEVTYLEYFHTAPLRTFQDYRAMAALVVGEGPLAAALTSAGRRSGLEHVRVESGVDEEALGEAGLVLQVTTDFETVELVEERYGGWLGQVVVRDGQAWLRVRSPGGPGIWGSVRRRLRPRLEPGVPAWDAANTAVANRLVHGVFRAITGLTELAGDWVTRVDLSTMADEEHTVVPHPLAGPVREADPPPDGTMAQETFSQLAITCASERMGLFSPPTERDLAQIPLHVSEIEVADPVGLLGAGAPAPVVTGAGLDFATARTRAALRAFACYGSLMVDRRRLPATGYAVGSGERVTVPAEVAFPALAGATSPYQPPVGAAAGYSRSDAIAAGLIEHCRRLTIAELSARHQVDLAAAPLEGAGNRYRAMLSAIGEPVAVYDVTGPLGVPTFLTYLGPLPAACASGFSWPDAMTAALEQTVLSYQARENGQSSYAPPALPDHQVSAPPGPLPASVDLAAAVAALLRCGHRPVAIPLDHDPAAAAVMPHAVQVVLLND